MPQMAPMNWTSLFLIFIFLYLISMIMIYFIQTPNLFLNSKIFKTYQKNSESLWKW